MADPTWQGAGVEKPRPGRAAMRMAIGNNFRIGTAGAALKVATISKPAGFRYPLMPVNQTISRKCAPDQA